MEPNRRSWLKQMGLVIAGVSVGGLQAVAASTLKVFKKFPQHISHQSINKENMKLGAFSISLNVKDLTASKLFYENLGFTVFGGSMQKNYLIMKNGNALIGLFHGMFANNILTFNPGWDENAQKMEAFDDVRAIQQQLKTKGIKFQLEADEKTTGPASLMITDPDGNSILLDQHI